MDYPKRDYIIACANRHRELSKRQREYKRTLTAAVQTRRQVIFESSYQRKIDLMRDEKNVLRAKIWVANAAPHMRGNNRRMKNIGCHVHCQEDLHNEVNTMKVAIANLAREVSRVSKQLYELNRKTVPNSRQLELVSKLQKKRTMLEDQLEVNVGMECDQTAINAKLRDELILILRDRTQFNVDYKRLVQRLNSDRKYIIDLIEVAQMKYDQCIDVFEKIESVHRREEKEIDMRKVEMQGLMRSIQAETDVIRFLDVKTIPRPLADLQPKEYSRREKYRKATQKKLKLYQHILEKILKYTSSDDIDAVTDEFTQQEHLYYSYFNYANEMSYHMTLLTNAVNGLYADINELKQDNRNLLEKQLDKIDSLETQLKECQERNKILTKKRETNDAHLQNLLVGMQTIFTLAKCNTAPLLKMLGAQSKINLINMRNFFKQLEQRLCNILASVYISERKDNSKMYTQYVVNLIDKQCEDSTKLNDVVLTQQCPECTESEGFNLDDNNNAHVDVLSKREVKKKLYDKIVQPEMQYTLHSISQCRLPRSRLLAARRYI